jgi:hypothetical protein
MWSHFGKTFVLSPKYGAISSAGSNEMIVLFLMEVTIVLKTAVRVVSNM